MEQAAYYKNKLKNLRQAIGSFAKLMEIDLSAKDDFERDIYKNAAVQKFEYSIELYWKVAKLYLLNYKGIDESSPKGVLKAFYQESKMPLEIYESLLKMILHRNLLSHLYDPFQFEEIYRSLKDHSTHLMSALDSFLKIE
jgi:nucleotidyltransferase substrate binding protein (TIGR01987 family)